MVGGRSTVAPPTCRSQAPTFFTTPHAPWRQMEGEVRAKERASIFVLHPMSFPSSSSQGWPALLASPLLCDSAGGSCCRATVGDLEGLLIHPGSAAALGETEESGRRVNGRRRLSFRTPQPLLCRCAHKSTRAHMFTWALVGSSHTQPVHRAFFKSFPLSF